MKKFLTLFASVLMASSAFGQKWTDLVVNGDMEGEQDPKWSSFWCHDWRAGLGDFDPESGQSYDDRGQFQGFAEIIEDPLNPNNHCARVIIRSKAEADEAGNPTTDEANSKPDWTEWDSQFFIYANQTIPEGKEIRMSFKIRGEKAGTMQTQAHYNPGNYNYWQMFGDIEYTTEWKDVTSDVLTVDGNMTQESAGKFLQSIAFNLSTMRDGNTVYFDDVKLEIRDPKDPSEFEGWFNFLRKGTLSDDQVEFSGGTYYNFTGRDGKPGEDGNTHDIKARIVDDPIDGKPALTVSSIAFNGKLENKTEVKDEDGNPVLDDEGNPTYDISYTDLYVKENGDTLKKQDGNFGIDDWQTQFFVSIPHKFAQGEKFKFVISARADKAATVQTQIHRAPGDYLYYQLLGDLNLTEEWQDFVFEDVEIDSNQKGGSTIAFNCNVLKSEENNYYFRVEEFCVNRGDVTVEDQTLAKGSASLPVPESADKGTEFMVDMSEAVEALGITDFIDFINANSLRVKMEEGYSGALQPTTGVFVDLNGYYIESEEAICIAIDEDKTDGSNACFVIYNFGEQIPEGSTVSTKLCFVNEDGWNYVMDVTLVNESAFDPSGIAAVKTTSKADNAIYDLMGRRVVKPVKGLYIKNGKKFIQR
jgi:hypothetical protein